MLCHDARRWCDIKICILQVLYHLDRRLSEAASTDTLSLLRAHIVSASYDASLRMLVPRLHVFLPKTGRFEETVAANMALLPGTTSPQLPKHFVEYSPWADAEFEGLHHFGRQWHAAQCI